MQVSGTPKELLEAGGCIADILCFYDGLRLSVALSGMEWDKIGLTTNYRRTMDKLRELKDDIDRELLLQDARLV